MMRNHTSNNTQRWEAVGGGGDLHGYVAYHDKI